MMHLSYRKHEKKGRLDYDSSSASLRRFHGRCSPSPPPFPPSPPDSTSLPPKPYFWPPISFPQVASTLLLQTRRNNTHLHCSPCHLSRSSQERSCYRFSREGEWLYPKAVSWGDCEYEVLVPVFWRWFHYSSASSVWWRPGAWGECLV